MNSIAIASWLQNSPLVSSNYRHLWLGQAVSTFGDRFTSIALPILVYELTGSSWQLGLAFMLQVLAALMFGLWAGALSDRWDRRRTMIGADLTRVGLVLLIPLVLGMSSAENTKLIIVYILSFLIAAASQFFQPAKISLIPQTVPKEQLVAANALDQGATRFTEFLGYTLAGLLIAWTGTATAFYIDAGTFLLSAAFISQIRLTTTTESDVVSEQPSIIDSIREGMQHAWKTPLMRSVLILGLIVPMAFGGLQPLLLLFSEQVLGSGTMGFGLVNGAMALGSAFGFLAAGYWIGDHFRGYLLSIGVLFLGIFQVLGVLIPAYLGSQFGGRGIELFGDIFKVVVLLLTALPFFVLTTVANSAIILGIRTIVQESTPNHMIGRVFSMVGVTSSIAIALGASTTGAADIFGVIPVMIFWCVFLIVVGIVAVLHPALRPVPMMPVTAD